MSTRVMRSRTPPPAKATEATEATTAPARAKRSRTPAKAKALAATTAPAGAKRSRAAAPKAKQAALKAAAIKKDALEAAAFPLSAAGQVFASDELLQMIAHFCLRSDSARPLNLQRVCRFTRRVVGAVVDPMAVVARAVLKNKQYVIASFIQSELEGMLLLSAAELQKFPFESRTSGSTGYAYHLFRGSLIPRMIAAHGGMGGLEARRKKQSDRRRAKQSRLHPTANDVAAAQAAAAAKLVDATGMARKRSGALEARKSALAAGIGASSLPFDGADDALAFCSEQGLLHALAPFWAERVTSTVSCKAVLAELAAHAPVAQVARELHCDATRAAFPEVREAQDLRSLRRLVARSLPWQPASPATVDALRSAARSELARMQTGAEAARKLQEMAAEAARQLHERGPYAAFPEVREAQSLDGLRALVTRLAPRLALPPTVEELCAQATAEIRTMQDARAAARLTQQARTFGYGGGHGGGCKGNVHCRNSVASACANGMCGSCCRGCARHPK